MKAVKFIAPIFVLGVAFTGVAHAEATMDAAKADNTATKVRQVIIQLWHRRCSQDYLWL